MKKHISLIMVFIFILSVVSMPAHAALPQTDGITASDYFIRYGTTLSRQGGGKLLITFSTTGVGLCDVLGVATFRVECLDANTGNWYSVTGDVSGETGSSVPSYTFSRYFYGTAGKTYRVCVTFCCYKNGGAEFKTHTSQAVTAY